MFLAGTMETGQRIDTLTVPFLAIRETVLNMLAHRSWWDEDESLSVAIFDDRIVRSHPGINAPQIAVLAGKSLATIERHLSALRKKGLIGHQDSKKTGGYYVK